MPAPPPKRNPKRQPALSFHIDSPDEEDNEGESEGDKTGEESVMDMLSLLQAYKKQKSAKSQSRVAALEAKKKTIRDAAYTQIKEMKAAGTAYIEQVKAQIGVLQEQEVSPDAAFADVAALFGQRSMGLEAHLETLTHFLAELSTARADIIEENCTDLHSHAAGFVAMRKRAMKTARREMHSGMEQRKLATDAQAYIKHFKHLVQS